MVDVTVRALLVDDDPRIAAVVRALAPSWFAWEHARSAREAQRRFDELAPDLVLLDLGLPDADGVELLEALVARRPGTPIVVVTVATAPARIRAAIAAGACGYLFKEHLGTRLVPALAEVLEGGVPMSPAAARAVLDQARTAWRSEPCADDERALSPREREVVEQLARGFTYDDVATTLGMSVNTVRAHVRSVYRKLDVSSRTEAVLEALRRGLVALA